MNDNLLSQTTQEEHLEVAQYMNEMRKRDAKGELCEIEQIGMEISEIIKPKIRAFMHVDPARMWRIYQQNKINRKNICNTTHFLENMRIN